MVRVDGSRWLVDGRMSVDDVRDRLGHQPARGRVRHPRGVPLRRLRSHPGGGGVARRRRVGAPGHRDGQAPDRQGGGQADRDAAARDRRRRTAGDGGEAITPPSGSISVVQGPVAGRSRIDGLWRSLVSALRSGRRGPRFKSGQPDSDTAGEPRTSPNPHLGTHERRIDDAERTAEEQVSFSVDRREDQGIRATGVARCWAGSVR